MTTLDRDTFDHLNRGVQSGEFDVTSEDMQADLHTALYNYLNPEPFVPSEITPLSFSSADDSWLHIPAGSLFPDVDKYPLGDEANPMLPVPTDMEERTLWVSEAKRPRRDRLRNWFKQLREEPQPVKTDRPSNRVEKMLDRRNHVQARKFGRSVVKTAMNAALGTPKDLAPEAIEVVRPRRRWIAGAVGALALVGVSLIAGSTSGGTSKTEAAPFRPTPTTSEATYSAPAQPSMPNIAPAIAKGLETAQTMTRAIQFKEGDRTIIVRAGSNVSREVEGLLKQDGVSDDKIVPATVMLVNDARMKAGNDLNLVPADLELHFEQAKITEVLNKLAKNSGT